MLLKTLTIRQHLDPFLLLVVILCWWCLVTGKLGSICTRAALAWRVQALKWQQRPETWDKSKAMDAALDNLSIFIPILQHNDMLFKQSLFEVYERSNSGNTDWFAFIRAQCRVLIVGAGQGWEVFIVNWKVLRLFVRWLCDHSNCTQTYFNKPLRVIVWKNTNKTTDLGMHSQHIIHSSRSVLGHKD